MPNPNYQALSPEGATGELPEERKQEILARAEKDARSILENNFAKNLGDPNWGKKSRKKTQLNFKTNEATEKIMQQAKQDLNLTGLEYEFYLLEVIKVCQPEIF